MTQESAQQRKPLKEKTWLAWILLAVIVACQLIRITTTFEAREGFHSDESWSYGFANSTDGGYIYREMLADGETHQQWDSDPALKNMDSWQSSEVLKDYLTVRPDQRFDYSAVLYNSRYDLSPPLHCLILHTICSFFPDSFSWWYAFSINIFAFAATQLFLFLLGRHLFHSPWLALLPPGVYGFTTGALNTFIYLRPYALLTCLTILFCYLNIRLRDADYQHCTHLFVLLGLVTFLGAYTNIYFLIFALFMTLCFCIYLLLRKRVKSFFVYGLSVLSGALCMVIMSAAVIVSLFQYSGTTAEASEMATGSLWRFLYCQSTLLLETTGLGISLQYREILTIIIFVVIIAAIILSGFCFVCRKEAWYKRGWGHVRAFFERIGHKFIRTAHEPMNSFWYFLILLVTILGTLIVISQSVNVVSMATTVDRYFFFLMPGFFLLVVWLFWQVLARVVSKPMVWGGLMSGLLIALLLSNNIVVPCRYMFARYADYNDTVEQLVQDNDVVLILSYPWQLTYWSSRLIGCNEFFAVTPFEAEEYTEALTQHEDGRRIYLIMESKYIPNDNGLLGNNVSIVQDAFGGELPHTAYTRNEYLEYLYQIGLATQGNYIGQETSFVGELDIYCIR